MAESSDEFGLAGKICVVTGAGSGIGRGIAQTLARHGAKVAIVDRNDAGARETLATIEAAGGDALALACDVSDQASVEAASAAIRARFGEADVLVNNAGIIRRGPLETLPLSDWNALLSVNLTGYFICAQVFGRAMLARGAGAMVHISSITTISVTTGNGAYAIAKAGVTTLSTQLALEWGTRGVRSNVIHPGFIYTALARDMYERPGVMERRTNAIPARRIGTPEDIAEAVLFLASPKASYINGAELVVDGGFTRNTMALVASPTP
jgi:NAD(P)-dependent dehydrogenase (short-subunit alcohol dehydrogenase family)